MTRGERARWALVKITVRQPAPIQFHVYLEAGRVQVASGSKHLLPAARKANRMVRLRRLSR